MNRYLLTYDALAFQAYLETLVASNTTNEAGNARQNQSLWMFTDAAHIIFTYAKRRCYTIADHPQKSVPAQPTPVFDVDDDDAWAALDETEGRSGNVGLNTAAKTAHGQGATRKKWLPEAIEPVLEELPKWSLVAAALQEIEEEMIIRQSKLSSRECSYPVSLLLKTCCFRRVTFSVW